MTECKVIRFLFDELINSESHLFPIKGAVKVSQKQGVYIVFGFKNEILHIGTTKYAKKGLNQRLTNHLRNQSSLSKNYLKPNEISLRNGCKFRYLELADARKRALLEALATGLLCPKYIGTGERNKEWKIK